MQTLLPLLFLLLLFSCSSDDEMQQPVQPTLHRVTLHLDGQLSGFQDTRSTSYVWNDGAKLYLQLYNGVNRIAGSAVYSGSDDIWVMEYYGSVAYNQKTHCEVYYFENAVSETTTEVTLSPNTAIYLDTLATYFAQGGDLYLNTTLMPKTGRLRMKGMAGRSFSLHGLTYQKSYKLDENKFVKSNPVISDQSIGDDGYSSYIYASFANPDERQLVVVTDDDYEFHRPVDDGFLKVGRSGAANMPTVEAHNGWKMYAPTEEFQVGNVSFKMIKVAPGTYTRYLSSSEAYREETIEKSYLLGETEVTQELWQAVMGTNPSKKQGIHLPVEWVSWQECLTFLDNLSSQTGVSFRMPMQKEWQFAYLGGTKSKGYTYSGSNKLSDVAWYKNNSGDKTHDVKTKKPNELGFYDMSGNVCEFCKYKDNDQPDPPEQNILKHCLGGNYNSEETSCFYYSDYYLIFALGYTKLETFGLRLAASLK